MRKPIEYIEELDAMAEDFRQKSAGRSEVCIVVGFGGYADFVSCLDRNALGKLNKLVRGGGAPIGLCGWITQEMEGQQVMHFYSRVFQEYANEAWANDFMNLFMETFEKKLSSQTGLEKLPTGDPQQN